MRLSGKTALITGGTSGIGLATARLFQQEGARVAVTGQNPERLTAAAQELGTDVLTIQADVHSLTEITAMLAQVQERFGRLDVLFVNTGIGSPAPLEAVDEAHLDDLMAVNFKGAFFTIQQSVPLMGSGGSIILNTSWLNEVGAPGLSVLSASKAALRSLARSLGAELAPKGIRVNAVSPGPISTPFHGKMGLPPEQLQQMAGHLQEQVPMRRFGTAEEIAGAALFLASDKSSFMLGSEIVVDGGLSQL